MKLQQRLENGIATRWNDRRKQLFKDLFDAVDAAVAAVRRAWRRTEILLGSTRAFPLAVVLLALLFGSARVAVCQRATSNNPIATTANVAAKGRAMNR
jgi:hypothetical protein